MHKTNPLHALGEKSADKSRSDGKPHEIRIRAGKSGGFIVIHHLGKPGDASEDEHAITSKKALLAHVDRNAPEPAEPDDLDED